MTTDSTAPSETKVDPKSIPTPKVECSDMALSQLQLIIENDITLKGKYLRLLISGKGCDGFTYSVGFTDLNEDDLQIPILNSKQENTELELLMDPFTAFYLQNCFIDYQQDFVNNEEGFTVKNLNQREFSGKFWKSDESKVPPMKNDYGLSLS